MLTLTRITIVLAALATAPLADDLTVGPARSGAQYTEIQAAIDAAQDDDVILVRPGTYPSFRVLKPLRILGDGTGTVSVVSTDIWAATVGNIPAGEEVVLSGLSLSARPGGWVLAVGASHGTVVLHDLELTAIDGPALRVGYVRRVVLADSRVSGGLRGGTPNVGGSPVQTGAIQVTRSELWITDSEIHGGAGIPNYTMQGAHGIEASRATVRLWGTSIFGGAGSVSAGTGLSGLGGTGILASDSRLDLLGGPSAEIRGGDGAYDALLGTNYPGGPGIGLHVLSTARIQAMLPIQGGLDGLDLVAAPNVQVDDSYSSFALTSQVFPTLTTAAPQAALGSTVSLTLTGNPGALQVLYLSLRTGPTTILRRVEGLGWLDAGNLFSLPGVILPASGSLALDLQIPLQSTLLGSTVYLQAGELFAGRHAIGAPALVTITR